jgi:phosphoribosylformylglycinamidine cyclo-ligase
MNYKDAGVDLELGRSFVEKLKNIVPTIGGFNGMMKIPEEYEKPLLVSSTDGVGTKLNIAKIFNDYSTIGIDLVAMCVNDIITSGAQPLYFLDYISTGKVNVDVLSQIVDGIVKGCDIAGCKLLGGETAEHPRQKEIDMSGFCTGIIEENAVVSGDIIKPGDKIIGLASSGLHSNGYSLINDMLWRQKIYYKDLPELLTPTTIYVPIINELMDEIPILGMAHITGGGIPENLPRCIPEGLKAEIDYDSWERPEIFKKIAEAGDIAEEEMRNVFNLGIGYCLVVPPDIKVDNFKCWTIGEVVVQ